MAMIRKRPLLVLAALAALAGAGTWVLWPRPDRITLENFRLLRVGMSRTEVEAVLGPPGDYRTVPTASEPPWRVDDDRVDKEQYEEDFWAGDGGVIWVLIGSRGVEGKNFIANRKIPQSPLDNLIWWLRRQWRRSFP
jgi:hypothetical protein